MCIPIQHIKKGIAVCVLFLYALQIQAQTVTSAEYFIDVDPGIHNATPIPSFSANDSVNINYNFTLPNNLSIGYHRLYIRTFSNTDVPSIATSTLLLVAANKAFVRAEYFFDIDPGQGNGMAITTPTAFDSINYTTGIVLPNTLSTGKHYLYVRTLISSSTTEGALWSLAQTQAFYVQPSLANAEYFFDTDPGVGNGTLLNINTPSDSINQTSAINVNGLTKGTHTIFLRTKADDGSWSIATGQNFYIKPKLIAFKYWLDSIPQPATGTIVTLPTAIQADSVNANGSVLLPCGIAVGPHAIYMSALDDNGNWSLPQVDSFKIFNPNPLVAQAFVPGPGPLGTPLIISASAGAEAGYQYRDMTAGGAFSQDSVFLIPNGSVHNFEAKDTCGNLAQVSVTAPTTTTDISTTPVERKIKMRGYRYPVYFLDKNNDIIGTVNDHGNNLDTVRFSYYKNVGPVRQSFDNIYFLDRNWLITTDNQVPSGQNVSVQLYLLQSEFTALQAVVPLLTNIYKGVVRKYDGINQNLTMLDNNNSPSNYTNLNFLKSTYQGNTTSGFYIDFNVTTFSEFYYGPFSYATLPLHFIRLDALQCGKNAVCLNWQTANEQNVASFEIERSIDAQHFSQVGTQMAKNQSSNSYSMIDDIALLQSNTVLYYRIKEVDKDGKFTYSTVKQLKLFNQELVSIYPNPAKDNIHIEGWFNIKQMQLFDMSGKKLQTWSTAQPAIDVSRLQNGSYILQLELKSGIMQQLKMIKQ